MPIDAAVLLAALDEMAEKIGAGETEGCDLETDHGLQTAEIHRKPIDFGQFGQSLDSKNEPLSNCKLLKEDANSDFGQFGQRNSENGYTGIDLTDFGKNGTPREGGQYARARMYTEKTVQSVQSVQSRLSVSDLAIGQSLDSGGVTVQNPHWLQEADPVAASEAAILHDDSEERAAIIAEGAGVPRAWAEGYAALCAMPPAAGFWPDRWQRIIDATGAFLDHWAGEAIRCGWDSLDIFGCHAGALTARFDAIGLVMLLDRVEIVGIDPDGADLVTVTGARQRFRRRPLPHGTIPLWRLI